jgi:hypothetical protein
LEKAATIDEDALSSELTAPTPPVEAIVSNNSAAPLSKNFKSRLNNNLVLYDTFTGAFNGKSY